MKIRSPKMTAFAALTALCLCLAPAYAQSKPGESSSKVRKVLLYNKIGGWVALEGIAAVKETFSKLAAAKGFELVQLNADTDITLDYLKQFQVIVWNNNNGGALSVPSFVARQAVIDYLNQGGGWMLIHNAGDHGDSWPGLAEAMGTGMHRWGMVGRAEVVLDSAGRSHRELKWMMEGFPDVFDLIDKWMTFQKTVRPLPGATVVATKRAVPGGSNVIVPINDGSGDNVYLWAREVGKGRLFFNAIGYGQEKLMEQKDSIVPRLYWENVRYAAGDYQNGCLTPSSPAFDPAARIHVEAMCSATGLEAAPARLDLAVSKGGHRIRMTSPDGPFRVRLRDLSGTLVWERTLSAGTGEVTLDDAIGPGVYHLEVRGATQAFQRRLALP